MRRSRLAWLCVAVLAGALQGVASAEEEVARLDVLIVGDTGDAEIGRGVRIDVGGVRRAIEAGVPKERRRVTVLEDAEATPERVLAHYARMPEAKDTALFLYYSGRGGWAGREHQLRMGRSVLPRSRLLEAMRAKRPPIAVVLTDTCSVYAGRTTRPVTPAPDPDVFRDLFFRHRGVVDATAAKEGQEAAGDEVLGGHFTQALLHALVATPRAVLDAKRDRIVTWDEVLKIVARETAAAFRTSHPEGLTIAGRRVTGQEPQVFDVGKPPTSPIGRPHGLGVDVKDGETGLTVTEVFDESPARWVGLRPGDRLVSMRVRLRDGSERTFALKSADDVERALDANPKSGLVAVTVAPGEGGEAVERWISVEPPVPLEAGPTDEVPPSAPSDGDGLVTRTVFYATDRARFVPTAAWYALRFVWCAAALVLGWVALRWLRTRIATAWVRHALRAVWALGVVTLLVLAAFEAIHTKQVADRLDVLYGGDRREPDSSGRPYDLGTARVSFPPNHRHGRIERPSPWRGELFEDADVHMVVFDVATMEEGPFFDAVREKVASSPENDAFVFVHGYNVSFEDAVLRTAQIAYDLGFLGAPILFSWPSEARYSGYPVDEANVGWATEDLKRFLADLKARSGASRIHLVAHSMGNRALVGALRAFAPGPPAAFNQVVLAAPDIDAGTFVKEAKDFVRAASRVTLYASSRDSALVASKKFHGYARAGDSGESVVVVDQVETIDVSAVTSSHSYIGDNGWVLGDLGKVLLTEDPIAGRPGVRFLAALRHWILEAAR